MKTINRLLVLVVLLGQFIAPARAQDKVDFSALAMTGEGQVEAVIDPLRLRLLDGRIIQLDGLDYPDLTPYEAGEKSMEAGQWLQETLTGKTVKIYQAKDPAKGGRTNRMGHHLAHLAEKNGGAWAQGELLAQGFARVRPSADNIEMTRPMIALEMAARGAKAGLWTDERYAILKAEDAAKAINGWGVIEGKITASAMANNTIYLNFEPDWRSDFTIGIKPETRRALTTAGIDPLSFANKTVRVRGWVESYNGPYIELMHPVWLEVLPDAAEDTKVEANN